MEEFKYTKGVWERHPFNGNAIVCNGINIGSVSAGARKRLNVSEYEYLTWESDKEEINSNRDLMIMAPKLLLALQGLLKEVKKRSKDLQLDIPCADNDPISDSIYIAESLIKRLRKS